MELSEEELDVMELAFLFRMPLYKMLNEMPYEEYQAWSVFLKKRPPGRSEDYRAALLLSAFAPTAPIQKLFPTLAPASPEGQSLGEKLKGSAMLQKLMTASGGKKLEF